MPTPLPPKMQLTHIPTIGESAGERIQAVVLAVDRAAGHVDGDRGEVAPAEVPKRSSLPSRLPRC